MSTKNRKGLQKSVAPSTRQKAVDGNFQRNPGFFPFARYVSVVGVHLTLLGFSTSPLLPILNGRAPITPSALATACVSIALLQGYWAGWVRNWAIEFTLGGTKDEINIAKQKANARKWMALRDAWFASLAFTFPLYVTIVFFGAPVFSHGLRTFFLCCLVSLLTVLTPAYSLGLPSLASETSALLRRLTWIRLFSEFSPRNPIEKAVLYPAVGTFVGAWSGAFPLALDWDRPWQAWPLPPAVGAVIGYIFGSLGALTIIGVELLRLDLARRRNNLVDLKSR